MPSLTLTRNLGPIIRISPFELHVSDPSFYDEIYAGNHRQRDKYPWQIKSGDSAKAMGFTTDHHLHRLRREAVNPFFSKRRIVTLEKALYTQIDRLCERIGDFRASNNIINLTDAYLALTMDIITDYALGKSTRLLELDHFSPDWKETINTIMRSTALINHFGWLPYLMKMLPTSIAKAFAPNLNVLLNLKEVCALVMMFLQCRDC